MRVNKSKTTNNIPSPLTAEDQSLSQCLTLGAEGENSKALPLCHSEQSEESKISDPRDLTVILASRQYPQGEAPNPYLSINIHVKSPNYA